MKTIDVPCKRCSKLTTIPLSQYNSEKKRSPNYQPYCSKECREPRIITECDECGIKVKILPYRYKQSEHHFCSVKCLNVWNNKELIEAACVGCGAFITTTLPHKNHAKCEGCQNKDRIKERTKDCERCGIAFSFIAYSMGDRKYCDPCVIIVKSEGGRKSAESQGRRSKNEILFAELCSEHFNITTNEQCFKDKNGNYWDADVILHDQKVAVLWNGIWHYKQVRKNHSVKQVQARDKIKKKVIKSNGYKVYVVKDLGKHNPEFVEKQFKKFLKFIYKLEAEQQLKQAA